MTSTDISQNLPTYPVCRRDVRHDISLKIEVETNQSFDTSSINLSENGICFDLPEQLPIGREVGLWVYLPLKKDQKPIHSRCRIVWHGKANGVIRHGGRFLFFTADGEDKLRNYLDTHYNRKHGQP